MSMVCLSAIHLFFFVTDSIYNILADIIIFCVDGQQFSPELMTEEPRCEPEEEEAGSFSPQLLHADENEEAIDPQVDQAELVIHLISSLFILVLTCLCRYNFVKLSRRFISSLTFD